MHLAANVDSIHCDDAGRVRFHYTILDFAARWIGGVPVPGDDVSDAVFAPLDDLQRYELWSEAHRVIAIAADLIREPPLPGAPSPTDIRDRLMAAGRAKLLALLLASIGDLTIRGRYYAREPDALDRMRETNEAIHRVAGHLRDLVDESEPCTGSRADGILEALALLTQAQRNRLYALIG